MNSKKIFTLLISVGTVLSNLHPLQANPYGISTYAGTGAAGFFNNTNADLAQFATPTGVAVAPDGNVFAADSLNHVIRKITKNGVVSTYAGDGSAGWVDSTNPALAEFSTPSGVAVDAKGNVFVADGGNYVIRKITKNGAVSTYAGSGSYGLINSTNSTLAEFRVPYGVAVDAKGNVFVADFQNNVIRKITINGSVSTYAGNGSLGSVNSTNPLAASFNNPLGVAVDAKGNVFVADCQNNVIRKVAINGTVSTYAGNGSLGSVNSTNPLAASFNNPTGVAVDAKGNIFVADTFNHVIREVDLTGAVTTVAGRGTSGYSDGIGTNAAFNRVKGVAVNASGDLLIADSLNHAIREAVVTKNQKITFPAVAPKVYGGASFRLHATASSKLPVSYSSSSTNISLNSNAVTILGAGTATIVAAQAGNIDFDAAADVTNTVVVNRAAQSISLSNFPSTLAVSGSQTVTATCTSGQTVSFTSSKSNTVSVSGSVLTGVKNGAALILISAPESDNYKQALLVKPVRVK